MALGSRQGRHNFSCNVMEIKTQRQLAFFLLVGPRQQIDRRDSRVGLFIRFGPNQSTFSATPSRGDALLLFRLVAFIMWGAIWRLPPKRMNRRRDTAARRRGSNCLSVSDPVPRFSFRKKRGPILSRMPRSAPGFAGNISGDTPRPDRISWREEFQSRSVVRITQNKMNRPGCSRGSSADCKNVEPENKNRSASTSRTNIVLRRVFRSRIAPRDA